MFRETIGPYVLIQHTDDQLTGLVILQVDESSAIVRHRCLTDEDRASIKYKCKKREILATERKIFNVSTIRRTKTNAITL